MEASICHYRPLKIFTPMKMLSVLYVYFIDRYIFPVKDVPPTTHTNAMHNKTILSIYYETTYIPLSAIRPYIWLYLL